jgi:cellulose synthase/poly-beta-1,6-N-acetylglucosamine synthase-like glycosyltransferase
MDRNEYWYLHIARATDLTGRDAIIYRLFEMTPAILSYGTIITFVALAFYKPVWAAYLTIVFAAYWFFKTAYLSIHLRYNFKRMRHNMQVNWRAKLHDLPQTPARAESHFVHLVMLPFYGEPYELIEESVKSFLQSEWDPKQIALVLAAEARAGADDLAKAEKLKERFGDQFLEILVTVHPDGIEGDIPGKGSNLSYAADEARRHILDKRQIPYEHVIVSAFDADTVVYPQYFACLTYHVMIEKNPERASFQPVPLYNNNIWEAPMLSRVLAYSSSFWQMIQQERPEKLATFSSHAILFKSLYDAGYWQRNVVSEDSRIFWNLFARYDGDYKVVPMAYPVSMDANVAPTFLKTVKNIYKQHRRWTYGAENVAYILFVCLKNPRIPLDKKLRAAVFQIEGFWSLATHPLILFAIGWLPLIVGGSAFHATVLSYNLPLIAQGFLTAAMFGLIVSAAICMYLIPERPTHANKMRHAMMVLQWILVPATMVIFSSIPGLESQTRLLFGRYLGFWVTPKLRAAPVASNS